MLRHSVSRDPTSLLLPQFGLFKNKKVPSASCLHNSHSAPTVTQHLRIISCAKKKKEGSREWSQVFLLPLATVGPSQPSTQLMCASLHFSCARSGQSTTAALRVSKPASLLFSVRVCDLLEWMPAAPLHTCPHLHASSRLVCRWARVLADTQCSASASAILCADFCRTSPFRHVAGEIQSFSFMVRRFSFWRLRFSTEQQHA